MWFFKKKKKVGLVLGSGGARGLAHIGVIKTLLKHKVPIDFVVGSSSGALIGGIFAAEGRVETLEEILEKINYGDLAKVLIDPVWGGGLIKGTKTLEFLRNILGDKKIEDLKISFAAVATDINSAETVTIDRGDLAMAIRASISIPLVYSPVQYKESVLVDGGVSSPVPVEVVKEMGADIIVVVNLDGVYFSGRDKKASVSTKTLDILKDSYYALRYNLAKKEVREADIVIEPEMSYLPDFDFVGGKKAVLAGEAATEKIVGKLKKLL